MKNLLALILCLILCLSLFACNASEESTQTPSEIGLTDTSPEEIKNEETGLDETSSTPDPEYTFLKGSDHTFMVASEENYKMVFPDKEITKIEITKFWPTAAYQGRAVLDNFEINQKQTKESCVAFFESFTFEKPFAAYSDLSRARFKFLYSDNTYICFTICYNGSVYVRTSEDGVSYEEVKYVAINPDGSRIGKGSFDGLAEILWNLDKQVEETIPTEQTGPINTTLRPES